MILQRAEFNSIQYVLTHLEWSFHPFYTDYNPIGVDIAKFCELRYWKEVSENNRTVSTRTIFACTFVPMTWSSGAFHGKDPSSSPVTLRLWHLLSWGWSPKSVSLASRLLPSRMSRLLRSLCSPFCMWRCNYERVSELVHVVSLVKDGFTGCWTKCANIHKLNVNVAQK